MLVLKKKLDVLKQDQEFREQEISDNEVNGAKVSVQSSINPNSSFTF